MKPFETVVEPSQNTLEKLFYIDVTNNQAIVCPNVSSAHITSIFFLVLTKIDSVHWI